ncbi:MAG TPA: rhodanese-like domain-containing protein, partial [Dermatophilaceae bacterium]|nr:rhodanese-like domain-containing protein [Dermatophilaceae bacterium]
MSAFVHRRRRSVLALTAGAGLAAVLGLAGCSGSTDETLDAKAFATAVASPGVTVVDVRTPEEFAAGHLRGAVNIDVNGP